VADVTLGIVRTWFTSLPYLALAFMVALLAKSSAAGISVGAAVLFLEGQILTLVGAIGGAFERIPEAFPSRNVEAILALNGGGEPARDLPGPWQATAVLLAYAVLFVAIAVWRFTRRDVTVG
jgi:ABC-type transport system involved in multi-copper enzyme maturation permease subunit